MGLLSAAKKYTGYNSAKHLVHGDIEGAITGDDTGTGAILNGAGYGKTDTSALDANNAEAQRLYEESLAKSGRAPTPAEQISAERVLSPDNVVAQQAQAAPQISQQTVQAQNVVQPNDVDVGQLRGVQGVAARDVGAPGMDPRAAAASAAGAVAGRIQTGASDEVRGREMGLDADLQAVTEGRKESVAALQYKKHLQDINDQGAAYAANARGSDRGAARRGALYASAKATGDAALGDALIRANEVATARGQRAGVLDSARGIDANLAAQQAGMQTQTSIASAGNETQTGIANAGMQNARDTYLAGLTTGVSEHNADRGLAADTTTANAINARAMGEAALRAGVAEGNAGRSIAVQTGNADRQLTGQATNAAAANAAQEHAADRLTTVGIGNADRATTAATGNVDRSTGVQVGNAGRTLTAAQSNQSTGLSQQQVNNQYEEELRRQAEEALALQQGGLATQMGVKQADQATRRGLVKDVAGAVSTHGASLATAAAK